MLVMLHPNGIPHANVSLTDKLNTLATFGTLNQVNQCSQHTSDTIDANLSILAHSQHQNTEPVNW